MDISRFLRFIVPALTIPLVVGDNGTSVCYSREQLDDRNTLVRRITCEESEDTLYKMFPSMESVNILDLIDATCSFDEFPNVLNGKFKTSDCTGRRLHDTCTLICEDDYHHTSSDEQTLCQDKEDGKLAWSRGAFSCHAFNCSFEELPNVTNGSVQRSNCSGNSGGDVCNVTCDVGYYPTSLQETVCQYNGSDEGTWSNQGNLSCYAPSCPFSDLPSVTNGSFDVTACSGNSEGNVCYIICKEGYYSTLLNHTICEHTGSKIGKWTQANFSCTAPSCPFSDLPSVTNGSFDMTACSGNSEGDVCYIICQEDYYPSLSNHTICEHTGTEIGKWTQEDFSCTAPSCPFSDLPSVTNGSFDLTSCSGNSEGDVCYIICQEDYYPSLSNHTICEHTGTEIGKWTQEDFTCIAPSCPFSDLPSVTNGVFDMSACSGNSEGDVCYIICQEGYYPTVLNHTICEHTGTENGKWTQACFSCTAPSCPFSDLPSVTNGSFNGTACSGNSEGDVCYIICPEDYYPTMLNHTICERTGTEIGKWTQADFSCIANCKPSWQGHSYTWVNTKMSWADADTHCRSISAHLVYINDAEENSFVKSLTNCDGHVLPLESYASIGLIYAETVNGEIRLVGGSDNSEGRVEVFHSGEWSTVCDDGWDTTDGLIACQQLGFESVEGVYSSAHFGQGSGSILLDDINCLGSENRLIDCQHIGFYTHNCGHNEDASVKCTLETVNGEIRLAGGSDSSEGRVEVFYSGVWSTVCDDIWDTTHGLVTCRQLGFESVQGVYSNAYFGQGSGSILLDDINCLGSENRLIDCQHIGFYTHNCGHNEDASVKCTLEKILMWQDGAEAIYTNWISSPLQNSEYCVGIDNNGLWNIYTCESLNYFICEKESL